MLWAKAAGAGGRGGGGEIDITALTAGDTFSVASEIPSFAPVLFIGDSGTKIYALDIGDETIHQYSMTANDLTTAAYDTKSFDTSTETGQAFGFWLKSDGTKLYASNSSAVYQYSLSAAWDISTASYDSVSFSLLTSQNRTFTMSADGEHLYACDRTGADYVQQYDLSTAWDLSTASSVAKTFSVASEMGTFANVTQIAFSGDGLTMWAMDNGANTSLYQYSLSTAWDISTASYASISFATSSGFFEPEGSLAFYSDDTGVLMADSGLIVEYKV